MANKPQIPDFLQIAEGLKSDMRRFAKVYCLQWFDNSFQNQGFTDESFQPWAARTNDRRPGGAILIDTTFLRKSLQVLNEDENRIAFGTHVPYAGVHNYGLRVRAIQNVRAFNRTRNGKPEQVRAHTRAIDRTYQKRQFIGESALMMQGLDQWLLNEIQNRFNT